MAPSSLFLLRNAEKLAHFYIKGYTRIYSLQVCPVYSVYLSLYLHVHVTARKNQPYPYRFTQANQRKLGQLLTGTPRFLLKWRFLQRITKTLETHSSLLNINHQRSKSYITASSMLLDQPHNQNSTFQSH